MAIRRTEALKVAPGSGLTLDPEARSHIEDVREVHVLAREVPLYTVGEAGRRAGVTRKAIRVYEARGLLSAPERTAGGYRLFTDEDVAVLQFIRRAKSLGLGLSEIAEVLDLQRGGAQPCGLVIGLLDEHLAQIERTLTELAELRASLLTARDTAEKQLRSGQRSVFCRIIEGPWDTVSDARRCGCAQEAGRSVRVHTEQGSAGP